VLEPQPSPRPGRRRVHEQHQAGGYRACAGDVEAAVREVGAALAQEGRSDHDRTQADGNVDEEDPRPAQVRGQQPAEQHPDGGTAAGGGAVDPERAVAVATLGEGRHQQRQRRGSEQRASEALHRSEDDERAGRPGEPAEERAAGEQREPGDEQAPPAEQVGQPAAEKQRPAEQERVGGNHPLQAALRETELLLDRGQGDVHDRNRRGLP
jgi:hypothetical protein